MRATCHQKGRQEDIRIVTHWAKRGFISGFAYLLSTAFNCVCPFTSCKLTLIRVFVAELPLLMGEQSRKK